MVGFGCEHEETAVQLSNVPEVRPARRLLQAATALFVVLFLLNLVATVVSFDNGDTDRWLNALRLIPNLVIAVMIWRGYVLLAALAERAEIYKHALEQDLPRLRAVVEERAGGSVTADPEATPVELRASPTAAPRGRGRPARG